MGGWKLVVGLFVFLVAGLGARYWLSHSSSSDEKPVDAADMETNVGEGASESGVSELGADAEGLPAGISQDQYDRAVNMFGIYYPGRTPDRMDTISMGGELAVSENRMADAVNWFAAIPTEHPVYGLVARLQQGAALIELNRLDEAERELVDFWDAMKGNDKIDLGQVLDAFKRLEYLLSLEIRLEERAKLLFEVHRAGLADIRDSKHLFFPNLLILNSTIGREEVAEALAISPESVTLRTARSRYFTFEGDFEQAIEMLLQLRAERPDDRRVMAYLLEAYFESGDTEKFVEFANQLPEFEESEPWLLTRMRGEHALQEERFDDATKHFQEVLARDPCNPAAQMSLATAWQGAGDMEKQQAALERASILAAIRVNLNNVQGDEVKALRELADKCTAIEFPSAAQMFETHAKAVEAANLNGAPASQ